MKLPEDPMMLFSVVNMKLRDKYASLDELCRKMDVDKDRFSINCLLPGFEYQRREQLNVLDKSPFLSTTISNKRNMKPHRHILIVFSGPCRRLTCRCHRK